MTWKNKMPAAVVIAGMLGSPAAACGFYLTDGDLAALFGLAVAVVLIPLSAVAGGLIASLRCYRRGVTARRGALALAGFLMEALLAALGGPDSLIGALAIGLAALQAALLVFAALRGAPRAPLPGTLTPLADARLFASLPR